MLSDEKFCESGLKFALLENTAGKYFKIEDYRKLIEGEQTDKEGNLKITQEPNAANPIQHGLRPLLTMDVWEHAYYLDYQNRRPDHLAALWQIIDWDVVASRYEE